VQLAHPAFPVPSFLGMDLFTDSGALASRERVVLDQFLSRTILRDARPRRGPQDEAMTNGAKLDGAEARSAVSNHYRPGCAQRIPLFEIQIREAVSVRYAAAAITTCARSCSRFFCER